MLNRRACLAIKPASRYTKRYSTSAPRNNNNHGTSNPFEPRLETFGRLIEDDYAIIREKYATPKHPVVLAHGLFGFDILYPAGKILPGVRYWRGISEALQANGIEVIEGSVPPSATIEERAQELRNDIAEKAAGKAVNIIAGLDSRYMISRLKPPDVKVLSLTTIATPHRGSAFADYCFEQIGTEMLPRVYKLLERAGIDTGAFSQLTRDYMQNNFNPQTPNDPDVRYFSYGATFSPSLWSSFRQSHQIMTREEGPNDGLVSVSSSHWGDYKGTLMGVSHMDLINWTNRLKWIAWEMTGKKRK
ncbi:MAG: hypothetical protein M1834_005705 [Cirrosporium novae-zelandiae]|nr:MAG: hypothetical protein M1834_005705 [Cirrosporium novae-zelandiae]